MARFLLCEDDAVLARAVARLIHALGEVSVASNLSAAAEQLTRGGWAGALIDVQLGRDANAGFELLHEARKSARVAHLALFSGRADQEVLNHAADARALFLLKPVAPTRIMAFARHAAASEARPEASIGAIVEAWRIQARLTPAEVRLLVAFASGKSRQELARAFRVSPLTIKKHASNLVNKLGASSLDELANRLLREASSRAST